MGKGIQIFSNPQFGEVRINISPVGEPWFCVNDICKALGYSNPRKAVVDHVEEGDVTKRDTLTNGGIQSMTYTINS